MKLESERTVATVANAVCFVNEVIKEIAGVDIPDQLSGSPISDDAYSALITSEINKNLIAAKLPGA